MKILIAGDVFAGGDAINHGFSVVSDSWHNADIRIVNLENPFSDVKGEENKCTLHAPLSAVALLKDINVNVVSLANNHIHDKFKTGIMDTTKILKKNNIGFFGAGKNLQDASKPYWLSDNLCIFGYCDYAKPHMKQIAVADFENIGVSPLRIEQIPSGKKAILYFHWGREHVCLPPLSDVLLAKELLKHEKILLIVGSHSHRVQGYITIRNKKSFMCIGNFLFPNLYLKPPTKITYPNFNKTQRCVDVTRLAPNTLFLTYKKWKSVNRRSIAIEYDDVTGKIRRIPFYQMDNLPIVYEMHGINRWLCLARVVLLSSIYNIPKWIYSFLERLESFLFYKILHSKFFLIYIFQMVRKRGVKYILKKTYYHIFMNIK